MLTWGTLMRRIRRQIKDAIEAEDGTALTDGEGNDRTGTYSTRDLADFWMDAQDDFVVYVARSAMFTIPSGVTSAELPDDLRRVSWVRQDSTSDPRLIEALDAFQAEGEVDDPVFEGLYWYLDHSTIEFTQALENACTVRYLAYYPDIGDPNDKTQPIYVPRWAVHALVYYCVAESLERKMVDDADLRRWAQKAQDAGRPIDNPFIQTAKYFLDRYHAVVFVHTGENDGAERSTWHSSYR